MKGGWRCQLSSQKLESIFFGVASYLDLGDGISLDLGDGNRLGWVVQVVIAACQSYLLPAASLVLWRSCVCLCYAIPLLCRCCSCRRMGTTTAGLDTSAVAGAAVAATAAACSLWLPVLIVKNRPRETPETPRTIPGGVWCILITPAAQKVATDTFNGFLDLPVTQKSGMWHWRRSQRPIWGRELAPSRLQPPTEGTDGIRPAAGSPTTPRGCRRDQACAGGMVQRELGESGGGAGRPVRWHRTSIPAPHACPGGPCPEIAKI